MPEDFVPETELERAYIQSCGWESNRLWRRAQQSCERAEWAQAAGLNVSRVFDCAVNQRNSTLSSTFESIKLLIKSLDETQKFSLFKCLAHVVRTLLDQGFEIDNKYINVTPHLMLRLFFRMLVVRFVNRLPQKLA